MRKLAHFVAVAEELNFTRAAERLHMSQQALSASISRLESEIGAALLHRTPHSVSLTEAGESLLDDGRPLLAVARSTWDRVRRIGRGEVEVVRVGRTPAVTGEEAAALMEPFRDLHPEIEISVEQDWPSELPRRLLTCELDLALGRVFDPVTGMATATLGHHRLSIAVSDTNPLASRATVSLTDLAGCALVVWSKNSGYRSLLLDVCRGGGLQPREVIVNPLQGTPPVTAVSADDQFAFVTVGAGSTAAPGVSVLEISPPVDVPVVGMWVSGIDSPVVPALLAAAPRAGSLA